MEKQQAQAEIMYMLRYTYRNKWAPDSIFKLKDDPVKDIFTTAFFNTRLNLPGNELSFDIKAGRFLAGDNGARFKVTKFINGVRIDPSQALFRY